MKNTRDSNDCVKVRRSINSCLQTECTTAQHYLCSLASVKLSYAFMWTSAWMFSNNFLLLYVFAFMWISVQARSLCGQLLCTLLFAYASSRFALIFYSALLSQHAFGVVWLNSRVTKYCFSHSVSFTKRLNFPLASEAPKDPSSIWWDWSVKSTPVRLH